MYHVTVFLAKLLGRVGLQKSPLFFFLIADYENSILNCLFQDF
jgi:hypothetical protein